MKEEILADIQAILQKVRNQKNQNDFQLSEEMVVIIRSKIVLLFQVNKIYRNQDLSVSKLASLLGTNSTYVSWFFNQQYGKSFRTFLNELRVDEAKILLLDPGYDNLTLEAIGLTAGFNSKSSFFRAFKKTLGMSPKEFRNIYRNQDIL